MSTAPEELPETPEVSQGSTEPGPGNWDNDSLREGEDDVDPDDEDAELEPTGVSEADLDPDDETAEDYPEVASKEDGS